MKKIESYSILQKELQKEDVSFLLLYKSGSIQSECALRNMKDLSIEENLNFMLADVKYVRDIHRNYHIDSVPSLLQFRKTKLIGIFKGCNEKSFLKSLFEDSLYSVIENKEKVKHKRVVVYTTPTCPHCTTLKNYLKDNRIHFKEIDVASDQVAAQQMVKKSGQQGVPQIEINGRIIVGFNKPKIDKILEIK